MNINLFFLLVAVGLSAILFGFKPIKVKEQEFIDVPVFNVVAFTMYELNEQGLVTLMSGTEGTKYSNRYVVNDVDYTDNSKEYIANIKANKGIYKNDIATMNGDVVYFREDGLAFESQEVIYNKKTSITRSDGDYVLYQNNDKVIGNFLVYNNNKDLIDSKNVTVKYQIKKRDK